MGVSVGMGVRSSDAPDPQEEAETYFRKSKRYDLLIQFYQAMGKWNKV